MIKATLLYLVALATALPCSAQWTLFNNGPCSIQYYYYLHEDTFDFGTGNCLPIIGTTTGGPDTISPHSSRFFPQPLRGCTIRGISFEIINVDGFSGPVDSPVYWLSDSGVSNTITVNCFSTFTLGAPPIDDGGDGPNSLGPVGPIGAGPSGAGPVGPDGGPSPAGPPPDAGPGPAGPDGGPDNGGGGVPCTAGMPKWHVTEPWLDLWLSDEPLGYQPAVGPRISFELQFKQRETVAGYDPAIFSIGKKWNFPWLAFVTLDANSNQVVQFPGGGTRTFYGPIEYLTKAVSINNIYNQT